MKFARFALLLCLSAIVSLAMAGEIRPYNQQTFDQLTRDGKPVVLHVSAPWCPTCKAQKPIIEGLMKQPAYKDVSLMTIDFDTNKPLLKKFKVGTQSTLIAFKGTQERARSTADITPEGIEALVKKSVN